MPIEKTSMTANTPQTKTTTEYNTPTCPLHEVDDFIEIDRNEACLQGVENGN